MFAVETGGLRRYSDVEYRPGDAFLFGPETRGLPDKLIGRIGRQHSLHIPMRQSIRSLNLSNAIALVVYEAWRQLNFAGA